MRSRRFVLVTSVCALLGAGPLASAQGVKLDPTKVVLAPKVNQAAPEAPAAIRHPPAPSAPVRLSDAQYALLRPHLASLLVVAEHTLAPHLLPSTNLNTPGSSVLLIPGNQPPAGFEWEGQKVGATSGSLTTGSIASGDSQIIFRATNVPVGVYLFTVRVITAETQTLSYQIVDNFHYSAKVTAPIQSGMAFITCAKNVQGGNLSLYLSVPSYLLLSCGGCEILRVK